MLQVKILAWMLLVLTRYSSPKLGQVSHLNQILLQDDRHHFARDDATNESQMKNGKLIQVLRLISQRTHVEYNHIFMLANI